MTNELIISFIKSHYILMSIIIIGLIPFIPPSLIGAPEKFFDTASNCLKDCPKFSIFKTLAKLILDIFLEFLIFLGLKGTITTIIFSLLLTDLLFNHAISNITAYLTSLGVVTMYAEHIILNSKRVKIFGIIEYESKDPIVK